MVGHWQLGGIGVTPTMVRNRLRRGSLVRLHRGVYAVGHRRLSRDGTLLAAVFAMGHGAVVSHRDAAGLYGIRPANHREVDVTTSAQRRPVPGIRIHRATLPSTHVTNRDGIPVTTLARTLVDLAHVVPKHHLRKALHEAEYVHRADTNAIEEALYATRGRNGTGYAAMREALQDAKADGLQLTRSELELAFAALVDRFALPRPKTNATVHGREVDAWWPGERLAVELDGWAAHGTRRAFQRDREKSNHLALHAITLLRFTHQDITHRQAWTAHQITAALKQAA